METITIHLTKEALEVMERYAKEKVGMKDAQELATTIINDALEKEITDAGEGHVAGYFKVNEPMLPGFPDFISFIKD